MTNAEIALHTARARVAALQAIADKARDDLEVLVRFGTRTASDARSVAHAAQRLAEALAELQGAQDLLRLFEDASR